MAIRAPFHGGPEIGVIGSSAAPRDFCTLAQGAAEAAGDCRDQYRASTRDVAGLPLAVVPPSQPHVMTKIKAVTFRPHCFADQKLGASGGFQLPVVGFMLHL